MASMLASAAWSACSTPEPYRRFHRDLPRIREASLRVDERTDRLLPLFVIHRVRFLWRSRDRSVERIGRRPTRTGARPPPLREPAIRRVQEVEAVLRRRVLDVAPLQRLRHASGEQRSAGGAVDDGGEVGVADRGGRGEPEARGDGRDRV